MSAKKKRHDALKAKEKKQKIIAGVGAVILVGLLAFQVPRLMNRGKGGPPPVPQTVATPTGTTPTLEAPTTMQGRSSTGSSSGSGSGASSSGLITSSAGASTRGQLASFSRFESKDPFAQQVASGSESSASSSSASGSGSASASPSSSASSSSGGSSSGGSSAAAAGSGSTSTSTSTSTASAPAPGSAVISVNGTLMSVTVGSDFPQPTTADPNATALFHLVSLTKTTARISIAGGSYTSGASTVTLRVNRAVTLMNTADGSRFKLILKPQGTPVPGEGGATSSTPTVTLPAPTP